MSTCSFSFETSAPSRLQIESAIRSAMGSRLARSPPARRPHRPLSSGSSAASLVAGRLATSIGHVAATSTDASASFTAIHRFSAEDLHAVEKKLGLKTSPEQRAVLKIVRKGSNCLFTGPAGCGKSLILSILRELLDPTRCFFLAPTGAAAVNVQGFTIHSFLGVRLSSSVSSFTSSSSSSSSTSANADLDASLRAPMVEARLQAARCIVIDEISMVDTGLFEFFDRLLRKARRKPTQPWGGVQMVFCGDFAQLPPVESSNGGLHSKARCTYCFQTEIWSQSNFHVVQLTQSFRQAHDPAFFKILNEIRFGECTAESMQLLRSRLVEDNVLSDSAAGTTSRAAASNSQGVAVKLFAHKGDVRQENLRQLAVLPGEEFVFESIDAGDDGYMRTVVDHSCPCERTLKLKVGAQVLLLANLDMTRGLVNGLRGQVVNLIHPTAAPTGDPVPGSVAVVIVKFSNGVEMPMKPYTWTVKYPDGRKASRSQLPLALCYAISIHKSQGMTLDAVEIHLAKVFEKGMAYVALSRARRLEDIRLLSLPPVFSKGLCHPAVHAFYQTLGTPPSASASASASASDIRNAE